MFPPSARLAPLGFLPARSRFKCLCSRAEFRSTIIQILNLNGQVVQIVPVAIGLPFLRFARKAGASEKRRVKRSGISRRLSTRPSGNPRYFKSALDPLVREMIYIAVSTANGCTYCIHSHSAAARARGMTDAQHAELIAVIGLAGQTNHLVTAMQIPVDAEFEV